MRQKTKSMTGHNDEQMEAVRQRIERWRRTRKKRTAMPEELWAAAVSLAEERDVYPVARALKLNYESLKVRVVEAELERLRNPGIEPGFVELSAAQVFGAQDSSESVVELSRADGSQMTIRMRSSQSLDVRGLAAAFLGGQ